MTEQTGPTKDAQEQTARVLFDMARVVDDFVSVLVGTVEGIVPRDPTNIERYRMYMRLDQLTLEAGLVRVFAGGLLQELTGTKPDAEDLAND